MIGLVAEIAERVKRPNKTGMRQFENWVCRRPLPGWRAPRQRAIARLGALSLIASSALASAACGSRPMPPPGYAGDDARVFVREHRADLETEIARGSGPRIYDLAILADCQDVPELSRRLHTHREDLFSSEEKGRVEGHAVEGVGAPGRQPVERAASDAEVADRIVRFMQDGREFRCLNLDLTRQNQFAAGRRQIGPRRSATTARGGTP
jgi:hypothetical protein